MPSVPNGGGFDLPINPSKAGDPPGENRGNVAPPSTIAAQIVEHHEKRREPQNRETFVQLLIEVQDNPSLLENDLQDTYKLINVLVEAGLPIHAQSADNGDAGERQGELAAACLDVILIAIRKNPEVIFYQGLSDNECGSQLCLRLLPRLIALLHANTSKSTVLQLHSVLDAMLLVRTKGSKGRNKLDSLAKLYQSCISDILLHLKSLSLPSNAFVPVTCSVPSGNSLSVFLGDSQILIALPPHSQAQLDRIPHCLCAVIALVNALVQFRNSIDSRRADYTAVKKKLDAWLDTKTAMLWSYFEQLWRSRSIDEDVASRCLPVLIEICLALIHAHDHEMTSWSEKLVLLANSCCLSFLQDSRWVRKDDQKRLYEVLLQAVCQLAVLSTTAYQKVRNVITNSKPDDSVGLKEKLASTLERSSAPAYYRPNGNVSTPSRSKGSYFKGNNSTSERPTKRPRIYNDGQPHQKLEKSLPNDLELISDLFAVRQVGDIGDVVREAKLSFVNLGKEKQGLFFSLMGDVICASCHQTQQSDAPEPQPGSNQFPRSQTDSTASKNKTIPVCDCNAPMARRNLSHSSSFDEAHWKDLYDLLLEICDYPSLRTSNTLRVACLTTVRRFLLHSAFSAHRDLSTSKLATWCLQSLRSSSRELRLGAVQSLPLLLVTVGSDADSIARRNRVIVIDLLRSIISEKKESFSDTTVLAFGYIARICGDEERNICLLNILEYLGHENALLYAIASLELREIANDLEMSLEELLHPFWKSVAISVASDLRKRPQKAQQLADLMGTSVNQLLLLMQADLIPHLVVYGQWDILNRLVEAKGNGCTMWSLCMQPQNLSALLSQLLTLQWKNPGSLDLSKSLQSICAEFRNEDPANLLALHPIAIACEILKIAGQEDGEGKKAIQEKFFEFTGLVERKINPSKNTSTQQRTTTAFFEKHALGIMASLSDIITNAFRNRTERRRSLRAVEQMVLIGRNSIRVALPQIRACLESVLEDDELRNDAFSAWLALVVTLEFEEDLESLVPHTFTAMVQNWGKFSSEIQQQSHNATAILLKSHNTLIQNIVMLVPSLQTIPLMSKFESQLARIRAQQEVHLHLRAFAERCHDESAAVVLQALKELLPYLESQQKWLHENFLLEQPHEAVTNLLRALLDVCARFQEQDVAILYLCAQCLGVIGCADPNKVDVSRSTHEIVVLNNFNQAQEAVDFVAILLEKILVKAFHSNSNPRAQGFLAYVMQELLKFCGFGQEAAHPFRPQGSQADETYQRWIQIAEPARNTLIPFLSSRYVLTTNSDKPSDVTYPILDISMNHSTWLRKFVHDLLLRASSENAIKIFHVLSRVIRGYDASIASFLLPFITMNVVLDGKDAEVQNISKEFLHVLGYPSEKPSPSEREVLKLCSESIFQTLDYFARWLQSKKKRLSSLRNTGTRSGRGLSESEEVNEVIAVQKVEGILSQIPADIIATRAVECKSYSRALFHWEQYMRQVREVDSPANGTVDENDMLFQRLQDIYANIDEPDGMEGISAFIHKMTPERQALSDLRAGRWAEAQSWYTVEANLDPLNVERQVELLSCLEQSGQHTYVLDHAWRLSETQPLNSQVLDIVSAAAWSVEDWSRLERFLSSTGNKISTSFNTDIGRALLHLRQQDDESFQRVTYRQRLQIAKSLSVAATSSLQTCHDQLFQLHVLYELESLGSGSFSNGNSPGSTLALLNRRLNVLGSFTQDKQHMLTVRRATMSISNDQCLKDDLAASWLTTAKLARKENALRIAHDAVIHAALLGEEAASIESAKLLWKEGHRHKAIRSLEGAIASNAFEGHTESMGPAATVATAPRSSTPGKRPDQNFLLAKAQLLLARWLDQAGQTQSAEIQKKYQQASKSYQRWEKSFYSLGRFYNKLLESERALPLSKQRVEFLDGDNAKLVIENFLRSLAVGCKYMFETLPKLLTLWLDFGSEVTKPISREVNDDVRIKASESRVKILGQINEQVKKYTDKIANFVWYTALAQMISRISHPQKDVYERLSGIIVKVVAAYPQQSLWSLVAVVKSNSHERRLRGTEILNKLRERGKSIRSEGQNVDIKSLVTHGDKLCEQLLHACEAHIDGKPARVSLSKDLGFSHRIAPCPLVVPLEKTLTASLPASSTETTQLRHHKAFPSSREAVTISSFQDDVAVLNSLQRPRKLTIRGSDGQKYSLLCKPNDDLRKDARLMEFNTTINRLLKKSAEASKRRLYVKTYSVTPLNELCGIIEWVDGLKPLRDILIDLYRSKGVKLDYATIRDLLDKACSTTHPLPDGQPGGSRIFTDRILPSYRPVLHEWFSEHFAAPDAWFAARLRYTRSCAVASMLGYALGLGDRHGENVLLEESSGGVFHVDFNCLFEKGLTFDKPELVPFRLTHNMVDACGAYGVEGPWRRSAECCVASMRANEDVLLTKLETFVYDPTADFIGGMSRKRQVKGVPRTPVEVLESVRSKLRGLMRDESVPLSVEGHVEALIKQATDPANLAAMYIGWCAFL